MRAKFKNFQCSYACRNTIRMISSYMTVKDSEGLVVSFFTYLTKLAQTLQLQ